MAKTKTAWLSIGIGTAVLLVTAACSNDAVAPAPVLLMGATTRPQTSAPTPLATQLAPNAVAARAPTTMSASAVSHASPPHLVWRQAAIVGKRSGNQKLAHDRHPRYRAAAASKKRTKVAAKGAASPAHARAATIPLDNPAVTAPSSGVPSERTASSWVSPSPAAESQSQYRPPTP